MPEGPSDFNGVTPSDLIFRSEKALSWLQWLRGQRGLSQRNLRSLINISQSEIHRIETNQQDVRLSSFVKLSSELGVPPGWVLDAMIESNPALFNQAILQEPAFESLMDAVEVAESSAKSALARHLASACVLAAILLRCARPGRRALIVAYPTEDLRERFTYFAAQLEAAKSPRGRAVRLQSLRANPVPRWRVLGYFRALLGRISRQLTNTGNEQAQARLCLGALGFDF